MGVTSTTLAFRASGPGDHGLVSLVNPSQQVGAAIFIRAMGATALLGASARRRQGPAEETAAQLRAQLSLDVALAATLIGLVVSMFSLPEPPQPRGRVGPSATVAVTDVGAGTLQVGSVMRQADDSATGAEGCHDAKDRGV